MPTSFAAPFASVDLVARIEAAECRLLAGSAAAARPRDPAGRVWTREVAGGLAVYTGPDSPLNKLAGLGFAGPLDADTLETVEVAFAARDADLEAEVATLADPSVAALLTERGYVLRNFEHVLGRGLAGPDDAPPTPAEVRVEVSGPESLESWLDTVVTGFEHPDAQGVASHEPIDRATLEVPLRDVAATPGFRRYLATRAGVVAGAASLRIDGGIAQLCGASTMPEHRRRGIQTAFLTRRLADAARQGCAVAVVTTQPGSRSQQNVQRHGFSLLYARAILVKALRARPAG